MPVVWWERAQPSGLRKSRAHVSYSAKRSSTMSTVKRTLARQVLRQEVMHAPPIYYVAEMLGRLQRAVQPFRQRASQPGRAGGVLPSLLLRTRIFIGRTSARACRRIYLVQPP